MTNATNTTGPGLQMERASVFTTLGIRFWDFALDNPIDDGLLVTARLRDTSHAPVLAKRTLSGVYAFQNLPCLHPAEYPAIDEIPQGAASLQPLNFVITVQDQLHRFLPTVFGVDLPLPYRGLFLSSETTGSPGSGARAYLFSAPTRPLTPGLAAVRTDLWDVEADRPASYASLRVRIDGKTWTGFADEKGRALVAFPYPLAKRLSMGSPPGLGQGSATSTSWPLALQVFYEPAQLRFPLANTQDVEWPWNVVPGLRSVVEGQAAASLHLTESGPPVAEWTGDLTCTQDLVISTTFTSTSELSGYLLISSRISSP